MKIKSIVWQIQTTTILSLLLLTNAATAGQKLNKEELSTLLVGSFMKIVYQYKGEGVPMWE